MNLQWWNLNSIFSAPEPLSPFYLSAFLGTLQEQGYSIFVVRPALHVAPCSLAMAGMQSVQIIGVTVAMV